MKPCHIKDQRLYANMFLVLVGIFRIVIVFQWNLRFQMNCGHVSEALSHDPGCAWPDLGGLWDTPFFRFWIFVSVLKMQNASLQVSG